MIGETMYIMSIINYITQNVSEHAQVYTDIHTIIVTRMYAQ